MSTSTCDHPTFSRKIKRPTDESVVCGLFGDRGAGKTLTASGFAKQYHMQGWRVCSNIWLAFPHEPLDFTNFLWNPREYSDCVILVDELHNYASARTSGSVMNKLLSRFILQVRHLNDVLIYTSIRGRLVDWIWLDQTDLLVYARWLGLKGFPSPYDCVQLTICDQTKDPPIVSVYQYRASQYYDLYNTLEKMDIHSNEYFSDLYRELRKTDKQDFEAKLAVLKSSKHF